MLERVAKPKYLQLPERELIRQVQQLQLEYFGIEVLARFHLYICGSELELRKFEAHQDLPSARVRTNASRNVQLFQLPPWQEFHIDRRAKRPYRHLREASDV